MSSRRNGCVFSQRHEVTFKVVHLSFCRSHISLALRINSSDGVVLYATSRGRGRGVMSLGLSEGHLLLLVEGRRKVTLRSGRKYNDDQWHTVRSHTLVDCVTAHKLYLCGGTEVVGLILDTCLLYTDMSWSKTQLQAQDTFYECVFGVSLEMNINLKT